MANQALETWVSEVAQRTQPESIHWCDGSQTEIDRLNEMMVADGALIRLDEEKHPNSFYARSDVKDVARAFRVDDLADVLNVVVEVKSSSPRYRAVGLRYVHNPGRFVGKVVDPEGNDFRGSALREVEIVP